MTPSRKLRPELKAAVSGRQVKREQMDLVRVDPVKLLWHRQRLSKSKSAFADHLVVDRKLIYRIEDGLAVKRTTAMVIASALGIAVEELLVSTPVSQSPAEQVSPWNHPEWEIVPGTFSPLRLMSNGLVMRKAKVRHRVLENEFGRAKLYDIAGMPSAVRSQCHETLTRHAAVCRRLAPSPYISTNLTMTALQEQSIWTAVDTWVDGVSLAETLDANALPFDHAYMVMAQVSRGIEALHSERIVLRELNPESILICEANNRCLLTDLELAKFLEIETTVSSRWTHNPYRAPEVSGGVSKPQADLYSLGRLLVRLVTGLLPDYPHDVGALQTVLTAGPLSDLTQRCLSPNWKKRPGSVAELLSVLPELGGSHG